jgi:hypothetical protein
MQDNSPRRIVSMHEVAKATKIDELSAHRGLVGVEVVPLKHFSGVVQSMKDRALTAAVGSKEKRYWLQLDAHSISNALEILDLNGGDHRSASSLLLRARSEIDPDWGQPAARRPRHEEQKTNAAFVVGTQVAKVIVQDAGGPVVTQDDHDPSAVHATDKVFADLFHDARETDGLLVSPGDGQQQGPTRPPGRARDDVDRVTADGGINAGVELTGRDVFDKVVITEVRDCRLNAAEHALNGLSLPGFDTDLARKLLDGGEHWLILPQDVQECRTVLPVGQVVLLR